VVSKQSESAGISDVSNLDVKMRDHFLVDVAANYKGLEQQKDALNWLQSNIPEGILEKFWGEYSPLVLVKESKYQVRFKLVPAISGDLILGTMEFVKDGIAYNTITATSSLPGRQYKGAWNRRGGLIPPTSMVVAKTKAGLTVKTTPIYMPNVTGVSGNFYQIFPFEMETDGDVRGDWGIHFDANVPGSMGCIVAVTDKGWAATQREFKILAGLGIRSVELIVEYG
jgi:hypothetical protein